MQPGKAMTVREMGPAPATGGPYYKLRPQGSIRKANAVDDKPTAVVSWLAAEKLASVSLTRSIRQLTDQMANLQPIKFSIPQWTTELGHYVKAAEAMSAAIRPITFDLPRLSTEFNRWNPNLLEAVNAAVRPLASLAPAFTLMRQIDTLSKAHWIAHPILPVSELVGEETDPEQVGVRVADYVEQHQELIYQALDRRFANHDAEDDTKAFARELIEAHRRGLYRLIVPTVFPEIERCARVTLGLGAGKNSALVFDLLNKKLGDLPISKIGSLFAMSALFLLHNYFYKSFRSDSEADSFKSMIHRHGSQHGLLRYNESRDCLNAIFLFDFILVGCAAIREATDEAYN
jgi:hypothetical protein